MTSFKTTLKIGLAATLLAMTSAASATTVTVPASATVDNAVDLAFTGALGFGVIRATASATDAQCVGITLSADPSVTALNTATLGGALEVDTACPNAAGSGTAALTSIDGAISRPEFTITGVPAFQQLNFAQPSITTLELTGNPSTAQVFELVDFTAFQTNATPAAAVTFGATALTADVNGEVTFTMGATLATDRAAAGQTAYQDATYSGSFDVTVIY